MNEKTSTQLKNISKKNSAFIKEFKDFINRGSVVDLAVGVVIGSAFTAIVNSLVNDILMPVISLVAGGFDFTNLSITIPNFFTGEAGAVIHYGNFIQNIVNFLIVAFAIFLFVRFVNKLSRKKAAPQPVEDTAAAAAESDQTAILVEIRDLLKKSSKK